MSSPTRRILSRIAGSYKAVAIVGLNTLLLLVALELAAGLANRIARSAEPTRDAREAFFPADEDPVRIMREVNAATFDPDLYVGWMNRPFEGETLTIDQNGVRRTPGAVCDDGAFRIFVFGGSTLWGEGAPDHRTIPAYLQERLAPALDRPLCVTNYGQRAWVSTQNLVKLLIELQRGHVPDVVVYYDGYNDTFAAYATGRVGVPENFLQLADFKQEYRASKRTLLRFAQKTQLGKLVTRMTSRSGTDTPHPIDAPGLSREVVDTYLRVLEMTNALAEEYGFAYRAFWQPQLAAGRKPLTETERAMLEDHPWLPEAVQELTDAVYSQIETIAPTRGDLADLRDAFASVSERVYIDPAHVTSTGNRAVVEAMLARGLEQVVEEQSVRRALAQGRARPASQE